MAKVTVKIKSGKPSSGTVIARSTVRIVSTAGKPRMTGKPLYQTKAQLNLHIKNGTRPEKTEFRRSN